MTRASTEQRIGAAGERLLAGTPLHTDGALTVQNLIREAGVGNGTIYRSPYLAEFKDAVARHATDAPTIQALTEQPPPSGGTPRQPATGTKPSSASYAPNATTSASPSTSSRSNATNSSRPDPTGNVTALDPARRPTPTTPDSHVP